MRTLPLLALLATGCAATPVERLCDDYWEFLMRESPTWATQIGDRRYEDSLGDNGPEARARWRAGSQRFLERARAAKPQGEDEIVTLDLLTGRLELELAQDEHAFWQWDVDQMYGPQIWILQLVNTHPLGDERGRRSFAKRLEAFPAWIDRYVADLREGMRHGRVATRMATERVAAQLRTQLAKPDAEWPLAKAGPVAPVRRAFETLAAFLEKEYLPREAVGLSALPGGEAAYRYRIRLQTSLELTPQELHEIGLAELASIEKEMRAIAKTDDLKAFRARIMADRANFASSREEYLEGFRRILRKVDAKLPQWFSRLPKNGYEVKPIEEYREKDAVAAFYNRAPEDGSRLGIFYANCHRPETRPRYNMAALAVHEAVPGHHLQIALLVELRGLPAFRRNSGCTAYVEGWALYTERLADEMGVYETDLERFGMLTYQAWRACRLVVDTGIHALGWSRERSIEFFKDHLALSETEIVNEIDRYIIWPGQALAYKVGQREIQSLRAKAEKALGAQFRLPEFHTEVLRHGAVTLPVLRRLIERWIARQVRP